MLKTPFAEIITLIQQSRAAAIKAVNTELINLYWNVGAYISKQLEQAKWGEKTVNELAAFIQKNHPELKGFNRRGLYRMKQFYDTYCSSEFVSPVLTQIQVADNQEDEIVSSAMTQLEISDIKQSLLAKISWTQHLVLMSRTKTDEERHFYLQLCIKENYSVKQLERQIDSGIFERVMIGNQKLSSIQKDIYPSIFNSFKDSYVFEFLNLPEPHSEIDLQKGSIHQMKKFILDLGKDSLFVWKNRHYSRK